MFSYPWRAEEVKSENPKPMHRTVLTVALAVSVGFVLLNGCCLLFSGHISAANPIHTVGGMVNIFIAGVVAIIGLQLPKVPWQKLFPWSRKTFGTVFLGGSFLLALGSIIIKTVSNDFFHKGSSVLGLLEHCNFSALVLAFCAMGLYKLYQKPLPPRESSKQDVKVQYFARSGLEGMISDGLQYILRFVADLPTRRKGVASSVASMVSWLCLFLIFFTVVSLIHACANLLFHHVDLVDFTSPNHEKLDFAGWVLFVTVFAACCPVIDLLEPFFRPVFDIQELLGNGVTFSPEGMNGTGILNTGFRGYRAWSDLHHISLAGNYSHSANAASTGGSSKQNQGAQLCFSFKSSGPTTIDLDRLRPHQIEKLFLAIESWANPLACSASVINLKNRILTRSSESPDTNDSITYTKLWEQSLADKFSATNFVPLKAGQLLQDKKIKILLHLSSRALSSVYLAEWRDGSRVILKECTLPPLTDETKRKKVEELFQREAAILAGLEHPSIVTIIDHFVEAGRQYTVLEHLEGENLRQVLTAHGVQSEKTVLTWAKELCEVLQYLHKQERPVIHRDITPDNILLKKTGAVSLIDFGAATEALSNATGTLIGKQSYIAPEQLRGKAREESDIYALGCTMYFLLTGTDPEALSQSHPRSVRPELSEDVDSLIAKCTEFESSARFQSADELLEAIDAVLECLEEPATSEENGERIKITERQFSS